MVRYFNGARRICLSVRGQALIETALVVPFLMMIFVGAAELARIEYASIEIANAASAAAIYGAQTGGTYKDNAGMLQAAQLDAGDLKAGGLSIVSATPTLAAVCVNQANGTSFTVPPPWPQPPQTPCPATISSLSGTTSYLAYTQITVTVQGSMDTLFHFPGIPSTITLYGQAKQRVVGD